LKNYIIQNLRTGKAYLIRGEDHSTIHGVWMSEKIWFRGGTKVLIIDEKGYSKTFTKKKSILKPY